DTVDAAERPCRGVACLCPAPSPGPPRAGTRYPSTTGPSCRLPPLPVPSTRRTEPRRTTCPAGGNDLPIGVSENAGGRVRLPVRRAARRASPCPSSPRARPLGEGRAGGMLPLLTAGGRPPPGGGRPQRFTAPLREVLSCSR